MASPSSILINPTTTVPKIEEPDRTTQLTNHFLKPLTFSMPHLYHRPEIAAWFSTTHPWCSWGDHPDGDAVLTIMWNVYIAHCYGISNHGNMSDYLYDIFQIDVHPISIQSGLQALLTILGGDDCPFLAKEFQRLGLREWNYTSGPQQEQYKRSWRDWRDVSYV
ncbi:hypothetical protein MMC25_006700 [Agyrium rufum]|nr:hypothetical protein [Agyrium rufum]